MNAIVPHSNTEAYRASTDAATLCREIVVSTAQDIQGRRYVKVEGWQAIALAHGCAAGARDVERVEGGVRAIGEVRRMSDGQIISTAEGFVGEDEPTWFGGEVTTRYGKKTLPRRADYAIRAMAQTRAISRACRSAFAHVVVMMNAGLQTTPAEEVPYEGFSGADAEDAATPTIPRSEPTGRQKAGSRAHLKRDGVYTLLQAELDACKSIQELDAWNQRREADIKALPKDWYDALGDRFQIHREQLLNPRAAEAEDGEAALDAEFREIAGDPPPPVAGRRVGREAHA